MLASAPAGAGRGDRRRDRRRGPVLRASSGARLAAPCGAASQGALAEFVELSRGGAAGRGAVAAGPRPPRGPRGPLAGRAAGSAYRTGARVAWRRLAALGPGGRPRPGDARACWPRRSSPTSTSSRPSPPRASRASRPSARASWSAAAARSPSCSSRRRRPTPARSPRAAEAAHWRLPATVAVAVWREEAMPRVRAALRPTACAHPRRRRAATTAPPHVAGPGPPSPPTRCARRSKGSAALCLPGPRASSSPRSTGAPRGSGRPSRSPTPRARSGSRAPRSRWPRSAGIEAPLAVDAHRFELLSRAEPALVAALAAERLAPLAGETVNSRARLEATLLAWLRHAGSVAGRRASSASTRRPCATGSGGCGSCSATALDDPDARFELELVLRARRMILDLTVRPPWPSEPPRAPGPGGLVEIQGSVVRRAIRVDGEIALAEAAWRGEDVLLRAHASTRGGGARRARPAALRALARRRPRAVPPRAPLATRCSAASSRPARSCACCASRSRSRRWPGRSSSS